MMIIKRSHYHQLRYYSQIESLFWIITLSVMAYLLWRGGSRMQEMGIDTPETASNIIIRPFAYNYTQYLFNYAESFVKRGLPGEILRWIFEHPSYEVVKRIAIGCLILLSGMMLVLFSRPFRQYGYRCGHFLFFLLTFLSPATLMHFAFDLGRADIILFILFIAELYLISIAPKKMIGAIILLFTGLMLLTHEATLFFFVPVTLAYWFYRDSGKRAFGCQVGVLFILVAVTYGISTQGLLNDVSTLEEHTKALQVLYGERSVSSLALKVLYNGDIQGNIALTNKMSLEVMGQRFWTHWILFLIFFSPLLYFIGLLGRQFIQLKRWRVLLILVSCFTPLLLIPIAYDHFRWWAISFTNLFIIISFLMIYNREIATVVKKVFERHPRLLFIIIAISLFVGPLGVNRSFDELFGYDLFLNIVHLFENFISA